MTRLLYLLFTLGGVSALVYEVIWMRSFRVVFGSSTRSASVVLAAWFGGMALGSLLGARLARRRRPLVVYGRAELAVGLGALLVAPWLGLFDAFYPALYARAASSPGLLPAAKLLLALVALGPPTVAMGVTLPLMSRAIVSEADHVARRTGTLYALNTLGATAGALLATFLLPPTLGVRNGVWLAVGLNLAIGLAALRLARRPALALLPAAEPKGAAPEGRPAGVLLLAAAGSGLGTLALEVLFVRILSQRTEGSVYTFGLMLVIFLLFLAAGAALVARRLDRGSPWRFLAWTQLGAVVAILLAPFTFELVPLLTLFSPQDSLGVRMARFALGSALVLGPAVLLAGVVLPATWKLAARSPAGVGGHVGLLTGVNTLAGVAGSLGAAFLLLPRFGLGGSLLAVAALYALLAALGFWRGYRGPGRLAGCALPLALVASWLGLGAWRVQLQPLDPGQRLVHYRDGEAASVAVLEGTGGHRFLRVNHTYLLGSTPPAARELRQGRLPLLLHPEPRRVAFIGVATGLSASAVLDFPVERVLPIELVPGVVDALPWFATWNRSFYDDARVEVVVADGRNHLRGTRERFDVIVSDLFVPWQAGTGDLYSVEHFTAVAQRLAPGGLFAQWLPGYQLTTEELRSVTASFLEAFPRTALWRGDFHADQPLLALVGYPGGLSLDPAALERTCAHLAGIESPPAPYLSSPEGVTLLYLAGDAALRAWSRGAPLNTDDRPYIEYATPGSFFAHRQRDVAAVHRLPGELGPRSWAYDRAPPTDRPQAALFEAADLLDAALLARTRQNFEREYRRLLEVSGLAGDVRGVAELVSAAALRYRERGMTARSEALLARVAAGGQLPARGLLTLADYRLTEGRDAEAIELFERALERAPLQDRVRRRLVELLEGQARHVRAEAHLRHLLESAPEDARLRLDLAWQLDRQGREAEAAEQVARATRTGGTRERGATWRYLERRGLSRYVDRAPPIGQD